MPDVFFRNISAPAIPAHQLALNDQQGIWLADPGDVVVVRQPLETEFYKHVQAHGAYPAGVHLVPLSQDVEPIRPGMFGYADFCYALEARRGVTAMRGEHYYSLTATVHDAQCARRIGATLPNSVTANVRWGTKSNFYRLCDECGVPRPNGEIHVAFADTPTAVRRIVSESATGGVMVKRDGGLGGRGNVYFAPQQARTMTDIQIHEHVSPQVEQGDVRYVVEPWYDFDSTVSVYFDTTVSETAPLFMHTQWTTGRTGYYAGCTNMVALSSETREAMRRGAASLIANMKRHSFPFRYIGMDVGVMSDGTPVFLDGNVRMIAGHAPFALWRRCFSGMYPWYSHGMVKVSRRLGADFSVVRRAIARVHRRHTGAKVMVMGTVTARESARFVRRHVDVLTLGRSPQRLQAIASDVRCTLTDAEKE